MISVIIPTRNRADLLADALESISKQELDRTRFEILVIDNGSTDQTQSVIAEWKGSLPNLEGIYAPEPGLHTGRHAGMKAAKGDILVFADDDIEALPTWLLSIEDAFNDPAVAMVGGNNYPMFLKEPPAWLRKMWKKPASGDCRMISPLSIIEFIGDPKDISPYLIWGCNFAIRKSVLLAAGGFHPDGMPKELIRFRGDGETHVSKYVQGSGLKCVFRSGASVYHKVTPERMTYSYFYQRGFNQGVSNSFTQLREPTQVSRPNKPGFVKQVLGFAYRRLFKWSEHLSGDAEMRKAHDEFMRGCREGFLYHQEAYRSDPEVREWVHRAVYY